MPPKEPVAIRRRDAVLSPAAVAAAGIEPPPVPPAGDHLVMLGTGGGPVLNRLNTQTAIDLVVAGVQYLIDCGAAPHRGGGDGFLESASRVRDAPPPRSPGRLPGAAGAGVERARSRRLGAA